LSAVGRIHLRGSAHDLQTGAPGTVLTLAPAWDGRAGGAAPWTSLPRRQGSRRTARARRIRIARLHSLGRVQGSTGGKVSDRVWLFAAGAGTWSSHNERGEAFTLPGNVLSFTAHPMFTLPSERRLDATAWVQHTKTPFTARALLRRPHAAATQWVPRGAGTWQSGVNRIVTVSGAAASTHVAPRPRTARFAARWSV
jgi:hypothetical protein